MPGLLSEPALLDLQSQLAQALKVYSGQASVELGERLSTHPALRADHMTGG